MIRTGLGKVNTTSRPLRHLTTCQITNPTTTPCRSLSLFASVHLPYRRSQRCKQPSRRQSIISSWPSQQQLSFSHRYSYATSRRASTDKTTAKSAKGKDKEVTNNKSDQSQGTASQPPNESPSVRVTDKRSDGASRQAEIAAREAEKAKSTNDNNAQGKAGSDNNAQIKAASASPSSSQGQQQQQSGTASSPSSSTAASSSPSTPSSSTSPSGSTSTTQSATQPSASAATQSSASPAAQASASAATPPSTSSSELLKQRLQQAQERLERPLPSWGFGLATGSATTVDADGTLLQQQSTSTSSQQSQQSQHPQTVFPSGSAPAAGSPTSNTGSSTQSTSADSSSPSSSADASGTESKASTGGMLPSGPVPSMDTVEFEPPLLPLDHLFDTRAFVKRLEDAGFLNQERLQELTQQSGKVAGDSHEREQSVLQWIDAAKRGQARRSEGESDQTEEDTDTPSMQLQTQPDHKPHDPAQAIMELAMSFLRTKSGETLSHLLNRTEVENQRYLFTAALSELRTELQVRARNDAAALRSITTLLQREVDNLSQRMKEDIEQMKHDIQVDMNNRKGESKEEQNHLDQEIQDLNNRFTISLSDLKTEIEQSIKWDLTRRALALVFGIAAITVISLWIADYLSRRKAAQVAAEAAAAEGGNAAQYNTQPAAQSSGGGLIKRRGAATGNKAQSPQQSFKQQTGPVAVAGVPGAGSGVHLRPAEELGLIEQYETDQEGRYV
ncbi:unnamed protein product [Sympodiomycopsis kandeliae]